MPSHRWLVPLDILVGLFVLSAVLLGVTPSYNPQLSIPVQTGIVVAAIVYFAVAHGIPNWTTAYALGRLVMLAGVAYAALIILQYAYLGYAESANLIDRLGRMTTLLPNLDIPLGNADAAATFMEGLIPLGIVLTVTSVRWSMRIVWVLATLVCLYAIVLTFSAGALVALTLSAFIALIALTPSWPVRLGAVALMIASGVAVALRFAGDRLVSRWVLYQNSLFVASDYLFTGIGLGDTFPLVYSRYGLIIQVPFLSYAHNLVLSVWMGQGLPGLLLFGVLVVTFVLLVWRVIHSMRPRRLFHAAWLAVTVTVLHGLFDSRQYVEAIPLMPHLFWFIGLTAATGRLALVDARRSKGALKTAYFPWQLALVGAVALAALALVFSQQLRAAWYTNQGALLETRAELVEIMPDQEREDFNRQAQALYEEALTIDSQWPNANRRSGYLHVKMEDFAPAVPLLETAFAYEPTNPAAIKTLGLAYVWTGQIENAARLFRMLPPEAGVIDELGVYAFWRGSDRQQPLLAAYALETAQAIEPDTVDVYRWKAIGDWYRAANDPGNARSWYERVLAVDPNNESAQQALAELDASS
ncbi:MAG: O-antigen ligase family protein [Anaerolineae bacterium]|nr:O-antigen ligase family protein [Anaerolineae bacterium]